MNTPRTNRRLPISTRALAAAVALLAGAPAVSLAQQVCFPTEVVESVSLTQPDKDKVKQCIDANKDGLAGDADQIKKSRKALAGAFDPPSQPSVAFRSEVSRILTPVLSKLLDDKRDIVVANALQLAGEVGTLESIGLLPAGFKDQAPPAVRYGAAYGYKRFFDQIRQSNPVVQPRDASQVCTGPLAQQIRVEKHEHVLDGLARALESASLVAAAGTFPLAGVRVAAVGVTAKEFSDRVRAKGAGMEIATAAIRAGASLRDAVTNQGVPAGEPALPDQLRKDIGAYGGDLLAFIKRQLSAGQVNPADRPALAGMATVGFNDYFFAAGAMGTQGEQMSPSLDTLIMQGKDQEFLVAVEKIIGPSGALSKAPFSLPADRLAGK